MELLLFDQVAEALRSLVPPDLGELHTSARRYGVKVWFDSVTPAREHYEAQVIGAAHVADADVLAVEVGFHAEHPSADDNTQVLARLVAQQKRWRKALGTEPVTGPFLGRRDDWMRLSEIWPDPDLGDPELGTELALRLADYVLALEPLRRAR